MANDGAATASASTPNATSLSAIRAMMDSEPVLAKKLAFKDGNRFTAGPDEDGFELLSECRGIVSWRQRPWKGRRRDGGRAGGDVDHSEALGYEVSTYKLMGFTPLHYSSRLN